MQLGFRIPNRIPKAFGYFLVGETLNIVKNKYGSVTLRQLIESSLKIDAVYDAIQIKVRRADIAEQFAITRQQLTQANLFVIIFPKPHENKVRCQPV